MQNKITVFEIKVSCLLISLTLVFNHSTLQAMLAETNAKLNLQIRQQMVPGVNSFLSDKENMLRKQGPYSTNR